MFLFSVVCFPFVSLKKLSLVCFFAKVTDELQYILYFTPREHCAVQALALREMLEVFKGNMKLFK